MQDFSLSFLKFAGIYFLIINLIYAVLMILSWLKIKMYSLEKNKTVKELSSVSFLVPAYNEESLIVETIQTYFSLDLERKEIVVINDGSSDKTMELIQMMFQLSKKIENGKTVYRSITRPELIVINVPHAGKAQALNEGLKYASHELICTMDADTIPSARGLVECLKAFARNPKLQAAGGVVQVLNTQVLKNNQPTENNKKIWTVAFQRIEYLRTFICERLGWSFIGSTILISGAFCMLRKDAVMKVGGFNPHSIVEDFDLILRLRRLFKARDEQFEILPITVCYTQVPSRLSHLSKQRMRWQMGLIQTLIQNRGLLLNPTRGILGVFTIPYFWLVEVFSPIVVALTYITIPITITSGWINPYLVLFFITLGLIFNLGLTLWGIYLDNKYISSRHEWSVMETIKDTLLLYLGYKQINTLWRLMALMKSIYKSPSWGEKPRLEIIHQHS